MLNLFGTRDLNKEFKKKANELREIIKDVKVLQLKRGLLIQEKGRHSMEDIIYLAEMTVTFADILLFMKEMNAKKSEFQKITLSAVGLIELLGKDTAQQMGKEEIYEKIKKDCQNLREIINTEITERE